MKIKSYTKGKLKIEKLNVKEDGLMSRVEMLYSAVGKCRGGGEEREGEETRKLEQRRDGVRGMRKQKRLGQILANTINNCLKGLTNDHCDNENVRTSQPHRGSLSLVRR